MIYPAKPFSQCKYEQNECFQISKFNFTLKLSGNYSKKTTKNSKHHGCRSFSSHKYFDGKTSTIKKL